MKNGSLATLITISIAFAGLSVAGAADAKTSRIHASPASTPNKHAKSVAALAHATTKHPVLRLATLRNVHTRKRAAISKYFCSFPVDATGATQHGVAVYYGTGKKAGRMTASGEPLDPQAMTAASPTLPIGSLADVRNLRNGRVQRVRINDRGPYGPGLKLDVTPAVAEQLGMTGTGRDQVEILPVKETLN